MAKPAVILIGADKGGVGKTTVARTLLDCFGAFFASGEFEIGAKSNRMPSGPSAEGRSPILCQNTRLLAIRGEKITRVCEQVRGRIPIRYEQ